MGLFGAYLSEMCQLLWQGAFYTYAPTVLVIPSFALQEFKVSCQQLSPASHSVFAADHLGLSPASFALLLPKDMYDGASKLLSALYMCDCCRVVATITCRLSSHTAYTYDGLLTRDRPIADVTKACSIG